MPHVAFVPLSGFRVREEELLALGMSLPGLKPRAKALGELPALGLLTLAGMLPEDWTCSYQPLDRYRPEAVERIVNERPTLVAISALTASIDEAYRLCQDLRARRILTVLGGLHVTACAEEASQFADAVVVGSGEGVWQNILDDASAGSLARVYRAPSHTLATTHIWPVPRFDLIGKNPLRFTLQTARGCPLACDFCGASRLLGPFREKPLAAIQAELAAIGRLDSRPLVELADDNSFAGSRDPQALFEILAESGVRYFTECDWRIGERPDLLRGLAASGCVQVLVGIESLVLRYPGMGGKQAELTRIMAALERVQDAGVAVNGCFIVGADGETRASLDQLANFIRESPLAEVQITLQTPFPGTALHRRLQQQGRLLPNRGWSHYTLFDVTYQPDQLTVAELEIGFRELLSETFSSECAARRTTIRKQILRERAELLS
jgi:radical SAM superfamily enzyme YgiQ (UPF0313 family)